MVLWILFDESYSDSVSSGEEISQEAFYIFGGPEAYEPKRNQKIMAHEILVVSLSASAYLKWSEVPISFDPSDHLDQIPRPGTYPLVLSPTISGA